MSTYPEAPKSPCAEYTTALPKLRTGALTVSQLAKLRTHLQVCATCHEQAESISWQVIDDAMHRHYGIHSEAAPFLSLDDISLRMVTSTQSEWNEHTDVNANDHIVRLVDRGAIMRTQPARQITAIVDHHQSTSRRSHWRASAAVMAVIAVVALFAVVVHSFTSTGRHLVPSATHPGTWTKLYTVRTETGVPVVAPGDPSVVYRLTGSLAFQRSDNGGQTWTTYSAPRQKVTGDPNASLLALQASPLNAREIFVTISSSPSNPNCPTPNYTSEIQSSSSNVLAETATLAGGYSCTFQYVSTDGGSSWSTPVVPVKGDIGQFYFSGGSQLTPPFVAQGNRLYTSLSPDINGPQPQGFRLVGSTDGIHWSAADAPLAAQNLSVFEYAATSNGATVFATTLPNTSAGGFNRELWRSDDAGVHWTDLGTFPMASNPEDTTYLMGAATLAGQTSVYYATVSYLTVPPPTPSAAAPVFAVNGRINPNNIYASVDNGKTWQVAPMAGIPSGQGAAPLSLGTLRNGSLVMEFDTQLSSLRTTTAASAGNLTFFGWRPGDQTWTALSPSLAVPSGSNNPLVTVSQGDSAVTILALIHEDAGFTLWSSTLG
jgi:hypothetical protein